MRNLQLFIACSLDGFIAGPDGGVDWLFTDQGYGYKEFYEKIDVLLMERFFVFIHPVLLGEGLPLFPGSFPRRELRLEGCRAYDSGLVELRYVRSEAATEATK